MKYDPDAARKLLAEAGYGPNKPLKLKIAISPSVSGQMQPLLMNEFVQQSLAEVGIQVDCEVVEWNALSYIRRVGAKADISRIVSAIKYSYARQDPYSAFIRHLQCNLTAPGGTNWGYYCDLAMGALFGRARTTFDKGDQQHVLETIHEEIVDDALFVMIDQDVNSLTMSSNVKGFVQAQT
ncbi:hypothetical protein JHFBIEKO_2300 [Methylobacterium mesophilicum]|nr:hypothetical protein JHFBIEKO_2300 [Methylobacterium mesophilicum]